MDTRFIFCVCLLSASISVADSVLTATMGQLLGGHRLGDGDVVTMTVEDNGSSDWITVQLILRAPVTWWKGIRLHAKTDFGYWKPLAEIQDSQIPVQAAFRASDLQFMDLILWKAKTFGIHTAMYKITDANEKMSGGKLYKFTWSRD